MSEMEEKLGALLNNPQMMQQILSLARTMGAQTQDAPPKQESPQPTLPNIDLGMLQKLSGIAQQGGIDNEQQNLIHALSPFLSQGRVRKLERAMRAAKMARMASAFLNSGGLQMLTGR